MSSSSSAPKKSQYSCADTIQDGINIEKMGRSLIRNTRNSEKIRKDAVSLCDDEIYEESLEEINNDNDSDNDNSSDDDDDDFEPNSSDEDYEDTQSKKYSKKKEVIKKSFPKKSKNNNSNVVSVDTSLLHTRNIVAEINRQRRKIYDIVGDIDIDSQPSIRADFFQHNTTAINMLNEIASSKQSIRGPPKDNDINDIIFDHFKDLENVLKKDDDIAGASLADTSYSISTIIENTVNLDNESVETNGSDMITQIPKIPLRLREIEESFMRAPFPHERACCNGSKCEGLYIGRNHAIDGFILVEFPSEEDLKYYNINKSWPPDTKPSLCVICDRKEINNEYCKFLAKNYYRSNDNPMRFIGKVKYHNKIGAGEYSASDVFITDQNQLNGPVAPIVWHSRVKYQRETRTFNEGTPDEFQIAGYKQILTEPSSFRAGRTEVQSTSSSSTQH